MTSLSKPLRLVVFGLASVCTMSTGTVATTAEPPNLLFIITDQQFADVMSCRMGGEHIHTPAMDSLAEQGVLFTRAYSSNPICMPWRASAFTGLYSHQTGVTRNGACERFRELQPKSMAHYFKDAGYETAYSGKWHLCFKQSEPETHGFEILEGKSPKGYDAAVAEGALEFLGRPHDKPFLLVASFLNPHNICQWARRLSGRNQRLNCGEIGEPPALGQLPPAPLNLAPQKNEPDGISMIRRAYQVEGGTFPVGRFTAEDWRKHRWGYYRMVELVDRQLGRVLEGLRQAGLERDTVILFASDHGDCAGAHGFNQKTVFYDESARVPLIVSWKGKTPSAASDKLLNTGIDILPTLLDAAGLDIPPSLPGRSVLPLALGEPVADWREYVVVQNDLAQAGEIDGFRPTMEGRMVRTDRYKYCVYNRGTQRESLVDMQADPGETTNLAVDPAYRSVLLEHRKLLAEFGEKYDDPLAAELLADDVKPIPFQGQ